MRNAGRFGKWLVVIAILLALGMLLVKMGWMPTSWAPPPPSSQITGATPSEKVSSLVKYLNAQKNNDFARVSLSAHDSKEGSWLYTVMVNEPDILLEGEVSFADSTGQQSVQLKRQVFSDIIGRIFVETVKFDESAKVITVKVIFPIALDKAGLEQGRVHKAEKDDISKIRKNSEAWKEVVRTEPLFAFYPSMNRVKVTEIDGKTPLEKVTSLVDFLNDRAANDFDLVFFDGYDSKSDIWKYTVLVTDPSIYKTDGDAERQIVKQFKVEMHWDNIKNLFIRTAEWDDTAKGITVRVIFPNPIDQAGFAHGFLYEAKENDVQNLRKYPDNWAIYVGTQADKAEQLLLVPQSLMRELLKQDSQPQEKDQAEKEE